MCDKRGFPGVNAARQSITEMSNSVRVYLCPECKQYHVTKERNGKPASSMRAFRAYSARKRRHDKMSDQD
jgi:hypothetical protein